MKYDMHVPTHFSERKPLSLGSWVNYIPGEVSDSGIDS